MVNSFIPDKEKTIERYQNDVVFHKLVTSIVDVAVKFDYTTIDLKEVLWAVIMITDIKKTEAYGG